MAHSYSETGHVGMSHGGVFHALPRGMRLGTYTCNPLAIEIDVAGTSNCDACAWLQGLGYTSFTITYDGDLTTPFNCIKFQPKGCAGSLLAGATVSVYSSQGGALLAQGTTGVTQQGSWLLPSSIVLTWTGPSTVYVTCTAPRFQDYGQTMTFGVGGAAADLNMTVANGYHCLGLVNPVCPYPIPTTLQATVGGQSIELTFDYDVPNFGYGWYGSFSANWPGNNGCSSGHVDIAVVFYNYWSGLMGVWLGYGFHWDPDLRVCCPGGVPPFGFLPNGDAVCDHGYGTLIQPTQMSCYTPGSLGFGWSGDFSGLPGILPSGTATVTE